MHIQSQGDNLYAPRVSGIGTQAVVKAMIEQAAAKQPAPDDRC
jgi:hypothetical protein